MSTLFKANRLCAFVRTPNDVLQTAYLWPTIAIPCVPVLHTPFQAATCSLAECLVIQRCIGILPVTTCAVTLCRDVALRFRSRFGLPFYISFSSIFALFQYYSPFACCSLLACSSFQGEVHMEEIR